MQINARHGDESEAAHRSDRAIWIWAALAAIIVIAAIVLMSRAATGPGANTGRVAAETAGVQGGVAPGVGSTYRYQPGGTPDGTPNPKYGANPAGGQ
jgi:hypothetical protein